jgi:hypothetical protein
VFHHCVNTDPPKSVSEAGAIVTAPRGRGSRKKDTTKKKKKAMAQTVSVATHTLFYRCDDAHPERFHCAEMTNYPRPAAPPGDLPEGMSGCFSLFMTQCVWSLIEFGLCGAEGDADVCCQCFEIHGFSVDLEDVLDSIVKPAFARAVCAALSISPLSEMEEKMLAFASAQHPRLGSKCSFHGMPVDLVKRVFEKAQDFDPCQSLHLSVLNVLLPMNPSKGMYLPL